MENEFIDPKAAVSIEIKEWKMRHCEAAQHQLEMWMVTERRNCNLVKTNFLIFGQKLYWIVWSQQRQMVTSQKETNQIIFIIISEKN